MKYILRTRQKVRLGTICSSTRFTHARTSAGSDCSMRMTWACGPAGRQRSNMRGAGKPAKMLISGHAGGGGHVLAGGIVTDVEAAAGDDRRRSRRRSRPRTLAPGAGALDGALHAVGFLAARAHDRSIGAAPVPASRRSRSSSKGSGRRLAGLSPTPRLTAMHRRGLSAAVPGRDVGLGAGNAEGFRRPTRRPVPAGRASVSPP